MTHQITSLSSETLRLWISFASTTINYVPMHRTIDPRQWVPTKGTFQNLWLSRQAFVVSSKITALTMIVFCYTQTNDIRSPVRQVSKLSKINKRGRPGWSTPALISSLPSWLACRCSFLLSPRHILDRRRKPNICQRYVLQEWKRQKSCEPCLRTWKWNILPEPSSVIFHNTKEVDPRSNSSTHSTV